ncbi:MAG: hypothetical protein AVDCRST_MAG36-2654 [uncultured Nocardioidaceae bacterium]|uniref:DUF2306 domain-containing protein n=1 Tax=uncultured Nocardioidaceae bacterium TaxID=253824 RepID=A0A6J4ML94_9ACTN|nr:MAG: hypothetical protein AVDCRST_MAG36-2654 [uncultured Nocardioidaceae bacterium]
MAVHAAAALLSLTLGGAQLARRRYGDRLHRRVGRVWVAAMAVTVVSSFLITDLRPGRFTVFHALSLLTTATLTTGVVAASRGEVALHRRMMTGSWFGVVGAFVGAVAVPSRTVPQLAVHQPGLLAVWVAAVVLTTWVLVTGRMPGVPRRPASRLPSGVGHDSMAP